MADIQQIMALCDLVRQTGYDLRQYLGPGHVEKVYANGLAHRLSKLGRQVEQQMRLEVRDEDGALLGDFAADLCIDRVLLIELKACRAIAPEHVAQILGYLRAARFEHGLLVNFGAPRFEIKKYVLSLTDNDNTLL